MDPILVGTGHLYNVQYDDGQKEYGILGTRLRRLDMSLYMYTAVDDDGLAVESDGQNGELVEPIVVQQQQQPQQPPQQPPQPIDVQQQPQLQQPQLQQPQQPQSIDVQQQPQLQQPQPPVDQAPSSSASDFLAQATNESQSEGGNDEVIVMAFQMGARIEANYMCLGKFYGGNIAQVHVSDVTYDVRYDDGYSEAHVGIDRIRLADPNSSSSNSQVVPVVASTDDANTTMAPSSTPVPELAVGTRCEVNYRGNVIPHSFYVGR